MHDICAGKCNAKAKGLRAKASGGVMSVSRSAIVVGGEEATDLTERNGLGFGALLAGCEGFLVLSICTQQGVWGVPDTGLYKITHWLMIIGRHYLSASIGFEAFLHITRRP